MTTQLTCPYCGHAGEDVIHYLGKVGGSDEMRDITSCADIDACSERRRQKSMTHVVSEVADMFIEFGEAYHRNDEQDPVKCAVIAIQKVLEVR